MSLSGINSSPMLQWLQQSLSSADLASGTQAASASCGSSSASDPSSLFQQALQALTSQTASSTDPQPALSVNGTQGQHHHHHHHGGQSSGQGDSSFIDQLAQSILGDLQQTDSAASSSSTDSASAPNATGGSFIDGLASAIANDLLTRYQQTTGGNPASSLTNSTNQVSAIA